MSRKIQYLMIAGFLLFSAAGLSAQNAQELRLGSSLSAVLREGEEQWYSVRVSEEGIVVVETSGFEVDTYLEVYDASNNLVAENDDGGEDLNARVEFYAAAGRTYRLRLSSYDGYGSGPYRIWTSQTPPPVELRIGTSLSGTLAEVESNWYRITSPNNGFLIVETSGYIDTYLEAYDTSNSFIGYDDDGGEDNNARLEFFVDAGKTYLIKLGSYNMWEGSPYRILATFENIPVDERNTERSRAIALKLGEPNSVYLITSSESRWFRYESPRSGYTLVVQTRGSIDTVLSLYDSRGVLIAEDDDSGDGLNAMISERIGAGTFYIEVGTYSGGAGRCTLHAEIR